jgi:hypothetical protein
MEKHFFNLLHAVEIICYIKLLMSIQRDNRCYTHKVTFKLTIIITYLFNSNYRLFTGVKFIRTNSM